MKLCYETRFDIILQMRIEFKDVTMKSSIQHECGTEEQVRAAQISEHFDSIAKSVIKYSKYGGLDLDGFLGTVNFVLKYSEPLMRSRAQNTWQLIAGNPLSYFHKCATELHAVINPSKARDVCFFLASLQSLPSSEAFCERVFYHMRKLFPSDRSRSKDDLVRASAVVRLHSIWNNKE